MTKVEEIKKIKELGERYNSSLIRIAELMTKIAEEIKDIPYNSFKSGNLVWQRDYLWHSPRWSYGPRFKWEGDGLIDPRGPNKSWFHAGDFNCQINTASAKGFREAAKNLPKFMESLRETLKKEASEAEETIRKLEKMLKALEG